jgi:Tfp pilus assembly protein PilN
MIRINLRGNEKKPAAKAAKTRSSSPAGIMPIIHVALVLGTAGYGYLWYSELTGKSADLSTHIATLQEEQRKLDAIIKQDQIYEARKIALENRIRVIEDLRKNQNSPVVVLDALGDAINQTKYVWLSSLSQSNTTFNLAGTGSSVDALSGLVANLKATGYFHNINLARFQDARGNYTFTMTCEFSPPAQQPSEKGAN